MSRSWILVYPHQLFASHPAVRRDPRARVALVRDPLLFTCYPFAPAVIDYRSATCDAWIAERAREGVVVEDVTDLTASDQVASVVGVSAGDQVIVADLADDWLERAVRRSVASAGARLEIVDSPSFLLTRDEAVAATGGRKRLRMAEFYRAQRLRSGILVTDAGEPVGGQWSFDTANRKRIPRAHTPPEPVPVRQRPVARLDLPVTTDGARRWLSEFLETRLERFGDYEDAIDGRDDRWYHSILSPMVNCGLLSPSEVIEETLAFAADRERAGKPIPLNSLEGFVRQVIGWREFIRAAYLTHGRTMRTTNYLDHREPIPEAFWNGTTGLTPFDEAVRRTRRLGWTHHIERLMAIGNLMTLCRIDPDEVYRWFMVFYIDAWDWVMVPNVYAMSQYADGGLMTTKPYVSGSNYLRSMGCARGDWEAAWDGLYWRFVDDNRELFARNPRLAVMPRQLDRMAPDRRRSIDAAAQAFLSRVM